MAEESTGGAAPSRTPLHERHVALGARLVDFAGFEMPVRYGSLVDEHHAVRRAAGLFDVSHMGELEFHGPDAGRLADRVTPSRVSALETGRALYTALTTAEGTFVDDLLFYRLGDAHLLAVVNASNVARDEAWIREHARGLDVTIENTSGETALLALQGPYAKRLLAPLADGFDAQTMKYYRLSRGTVAGRPAIASRTGYTGEIGFEIFVGAEDAPHVWDALLEAGAPHGVLPAGLGARDTLRLEAGLPLYGNDIDETTSVLEAGLEFVVDWEKDDFLGLEALRGERERGPARRRCGFELTGRGIARAGDTLRAGDDVTAPVTSGTWSPTLERSIGMAYLPAGRAAPGTAIAADVRGRAIEGRIVPLPFYRRPRKKA